MEHEGNPTIVTKQVEKLMNLRQLKVQGCVCARSTADRSYYQASN